MADFGIKASKAGFSIGTATSDQNLVLSSKYNMFKVSSQGTSPLVIPAGSSSSATTQIAHGLGYAPMFLVYVVATDGQTFLSHTESYSPGTFTTEIKRSIYSWADGTSVNYFINFGTPGTYNSYYYLFHDPI